MAQSFAFSSRFVDEAHAVVVKKGSYHDGSTALALQSKEGEPLLTLTVCLPGHLPDEGNVFIKDYAENEGTVAALRNSGVIGEPVRWLSAGYADLGIAECPLKVEV